MFVIDGQPIPLMRPRTSDGRFYDPQKKVKDEVAWIIRTQHTGELYQGPLKLSITFYMQLPRASLVKKKALDGTPHYTRPDTSNLIKFVEDALNGILYPDDAQIAIIEARKIYDFNPRTEFMLERADDAETPVYW